MSFSEIVPPNPVSLANAQAEAFAFSSNAASQQASDHFLLGALDAAADRLNFLERQYWVETSRALAIPVSFERDQQVSLGNFYQLSFEGEFISYSKVVIGKIIGGGAVQALCMTFNKPTLLPYFDTLPDHLLLHVPVLAVTEITPTRD